MSSDEEEGSNRQREFQTSFEEDSTKSAHQSALCNITTSPNTLTQITAKASDDSDKMDISSPYNACEFTCGALLA